MAARRGLHATYGIPAVSSQPCVRCHSDHNGEDFPLIKWDPKNFDHKQTGYVLEGKHLGLECSRCHSAAHIGPSERSQIKVRDLNRTFLGLSPTCTTCHQDQHKGRLGQNCLQCHNYSDWKSVTVGQFDHAKTSYPLTGLHVSVTCQKCHTPGAEGKPRYTGLPFAKCSDCHQDPHRGSFVQSCQSCHNTAGWKKVSLEAVNQRFDHAKTNYPLEGKHLAVACSNCHRGGDFKKPLAFQKCMDCHIPDPHNGQFAKRPGGPECASCHTVEGFKPAKFGVKEHATSAYPLEGKHASVQCDQCHIPKGKDTLFKIKFQKCADCHRDQHSGQFASAPYFNACDRCHNLQGYRPSTFTLAQHKQTAFVLTGGHIAVPCSQCHKPVSELQPKESIVYHWKDLSCTSCHEDPHSGQFKERMLRISSGKPMGCEACHSTKSWKELTGFDHATTSFPLVGAHRATACIDCHKPPNLETTLVHADFKAAPTRCEQCHEDPHGQQFAKSGATECVACHNSAKWKPSLFDHDQRTTFALQGLHRNVRCDGCHKLVRTIDDKAVLFYKPTPKECAACHGTTVPNRNSVQ